MLLLDTNICIYVIKKRPARVIRELLARSPAEVGISSITLGELQLGVEKSGRRERNQDALSRFLTPLQIFPFDGQAAIAYARVRADLEKRGRTIGSLDMMIGAHALALGATLVTNNVREFTRIKGLRVENWTRARR